MDVLIAVRGVTMRRHLIRDGRTALARGGLAELVEHS